ncbi:hypothetical protein M422DRAFT_29230 [Sphaerobolus stellatus SS14]|nr:hypothetical protein M422DRAFT_29230 [Sphaerobolus stellatus SS14]
MSQSHPVPANEHIGAGAIYHDLPRDPSSKDAFRGDLGHGNNGAAPNAFHGANGLHKDSLFDAPSQLPFDAFSGQPLRRASQQNLAVVPQHGNLSGGDSLNLSSETSSLASSRITERESVKTQPYPALAAAPPQQRSRSDLTNATRSSPGPVGGVAPPFDLPLHDEGPFEAARRAQKAQKNGASVESLHQERKFIPGRVPSIKPGEIMPDYLIPLIHGPPMFMPPIEAPAFPPVLISLPIRAAHFPLPPADPDHSYFPPQPPLQTAGHTPRPQLPLPAPSYTQTAHSTPSPQPQAQSPSNGIYLMNDPSREHMHQISPAQSQLARAPSRAQTLPQQPNGQNSNSIHPPPNVLRRNTHDSHINGHSAPIPNGLQAPHPSPPGPYGSQPPPPDAQDQRDRYSPQPPSRSPSQYHPQRASPSPERPPNAVPHPRRESPPPLSTRESFRQSLRPSPLRTGFAPAPNPIRLPSENAKAEQGPRQEGPLRATPRPIMPPLLAPLAAQDKNSGARSGPLQRSQSSATPAEKGGLFSRTKSLLRKRSSASGLRLGANGGISFTPPMHSVSEEDEKPKKLKRRGLF